MAPQYGRHALLALLLGAVLASCAASQGSSQSGPDSPAPASGQGPSQGSSAVDALAFMAVTLLIGIFTLHLLAPVTHLPYTALLLARTQHRPLHARLRATTTAVLRPTALGAAPVLCSSHAICTRGASAWKHLRWHTAGVGCDPGHWQQVLLV